MDQGRRTPLPIEGSTGTAAIVEASFVPPRYEPNYAYPLLVLFHGRGGDEHHFVASSSGLGWRNYVALGLRGPEPVVRRGRPIGFGWGPQFARPGQPRVRPAAGAPAPSPAEVVRRRLFDGRLDALDALEDAVFASILRTMRALHIHSERIFLVGTGEGAAVAYRLGLTYPERFAGVVAINGWLPATPRPLANVKAARGLRILALHGQWNARIPVETARGEINTLRAGGLNVAFQAYPCAHRISSPMLNDLDTWLINQCTGPC